ncbi:RHS repeat-associated core domain-containing protein [Lachnotalea glycerini]|nr:RHS repeat-associated core domain-containing protein [Lachnotalea glycerini]
MGSITHVTEQDEVLNRYEYDAWGNVTESEERVENRFQFNGQQLNPISQQYYLRARYYNPVIGRFTQEDTYRGDGLNLYAYCANNPVSYVDPSGNQCQAAKDRLAASTSKGKNETKTSTKLTEHQDSSSKGSGGHEITYPTEKSHESARNTLMNEVDKSGAFTNGSQPYTGRLESSYGYEQKIGRQSLDGKTRWRLDYDPDKGVHYNFEDFSKGKGNKAVKIAIPIDINYEQYKSIIDLYNR